MEANSVSKWCFFLCLFLIWGVQLTQCNVTYDRKALIINGHKRILFSGSIHYPRSTPEMWKGLIQKAKDGGLDVIDTYVFWNLHEPSPGNIAMQRFTKKIVQMMKDEKLFESQGGPIILSQIENEYGAISKFSGNASLAYMRWAAKMAVELGTGVPWVMCLQDDAPDPVYQGGTNFGRTAGGPFITTSYDYDAPIDEYGLIRQPKYGHLKELHRAIKLCERALVSADPTVTRLGRYEQTDARVRFNNMYYDLPPWSISILPDCENVVFNTAKVGVQTSKTRMLPTDAKLLSWETFSEDLSSANDDTDITTVGLLEQLNVTRDISDYLWYTTSVDIRASASFLRRGQRITLTVQSAGDALHVFVNGQLSGSAFGSREYKRFTFTGEVNLRAGRNIISLLSVAVGLPVGLKGERMNLVSPIGVSSVGWIPESLFARSPRPLTWYKAYFNAPEGDDPLALDMVSMGKGQVWINGQSIGRYWTLHAHGNCTQCSYSGHYNPTKCQLGCGQPTQRWYHVPRSWLKPTHNQLVVFEELLGDVSRISLVKRSVTNS
ncbi:hypothetical protein RHSIM_Rhsim11G0181200 [Rhododendron simsii]|uniref:beta-galactosidase n=1 Tax=Rhododendron simsii TaxID=118357 RepID=A0A834LBP6_RHOSS|nr:hypothetical protein RHSIM_Rhsim11G0181200 [Rhododendron simsii]